MKLGNVFICVALLFILSGTGPVLAEEKTGDQVFDLGQVLVIDKSQSSDKITTTDVVSAEDIRLQGAQNVADALDLVPGVDVQIGGKGQYGIKLRGFDQQDVKILIDGVPTHSSYNGSVDLGQIPVDAIAQIKVIKGASSVLYGPNTLGGVINIITKKGGAEPYTQVTTSFGQNATQNYILNHGGSKGKFNYWVTASHRTSDGFELSSDFDPNNPRTGIGSEYNEAGGTRDLSHYTNNTLNTKFGYDFDDNSKIYFSFDYHDNEKGCPTEGGGRFNYPRYWEFDEWKQWNASLVGEHDFTEILTMKARLYYVDHEDTLKDLNWDNRPAHNFPAGRWFDESSYDDYTVGGELHAYLDFGDISLLKLGASYMKDNNKQTDYWMDTGYEPEEEYETNVYSFGIEDEIRLFEKLTLKAGVSYDTHDPQKAYGGVSRDKTSEWNPQAGIAYDFSKAFNLYASVGKKTRFPQMQKLYSNLAGGNSELNAQTTIAYEIGGSKQFGDSVTLTAAGFFNDVKTELSETPAGSMKMSGKPISRGLKPPYGT
ncbi:MAG: TonB-dependent receptor [Desulfobacter sp.]|nr:TonB-dependent receptor [Desulfobacter sp.]